MGSDHGTMRDDQVVVTLVGEAWAGEAFERGIAFHKATVLKVSYRGHVSNVEVLEGGVSPTVSVYEIPPGVPQPSFDAARLGHRIVDSVDTVETAVRELVAGVLAGRIQVVRGQLRLA